MFGEQSSLSGALFLKDLLASSSLACVPTATSRRTETAVGLGLSPCTASQPRSSNPGPRPGTVSQALSSLRCILCYLCRSACLSIQSLVHHCVAAYRRRSGTPLQYALMICFDVHWVLLPEGWTRRLQGISRHHLMQAAPSPRTWSLDILKRSCSRSSRNGKPASECRHRNVNDVHRPAVGRAPRWNGFRSIFGFGHELLFRTHLYNSVFF